MWLFTKYGFYSVVQSYTWHDDLKVTDPDNFVVRARCKDHLINLLTAFDETLSMCHIVETTDSDYQFRIRVPRREWLMVVATLTESINYDNFKGAVHNYEDTGTGPVKHSPYERALMQVWQTMQSLQPLPPWSAARTAKPKRSSSLIHKAKGKGKPPLRSSKRGRS